MRSQPQILVPATGRTTTISDRLLEFIARFCLVLIFPLSCLNKIFDYQSAMAQAAHGWIPLPPTAAALLLVLAGTLEAVGFVSCLIFIVVRRPYCSYSTWSRPQFCFTTSGVFPSTAMRGMRTYGRSSRILGWPEVFYSLLQTQRWNRSAARSHGVRGMVKIE